MNQKESQGWKVGLLLDQWRIHKCDKDNLNLSNVFTLFQSQPILMFFCSNWHSEKTVKWRTARRPCPHFPILHLAEKQKFFSKGLVLSPSFKKYTKSKLNSRITCFLKKRKSEGSVSWAEVCKEWVTFYSGKLDVFLIVEHFSHSLTS